MRTKRAGALRNGWSAILAVFALLLHSLLASAVDGAMAQPELVDYFGNPICSAHVSGEANSPDQPGSHTHLPDCCLAGCSLAGGHALAPDTQPFLVVRLAERTTAIAPVYRTTPTTFERLPQNPRAPPASV